MTSSPVSKEGIEDVMQAIVDVPEKDRVYAQRMLSEWGISKDGHSVRLFLALKCLTPGRVSKRAFTEWKDVVRQKREVSRDFWVVPNSDATTVLQADHNLNKYIVTPEELNRLQQGLSGTGDVAFPGHTIFAATTPFWQLPNSAFKFSASLASESVSSPCASSRFGPANEQPTLGQGHAQAPLCEDSCSPEGHAHNLGSAQSHAQGHSEGHAEGSDAPQGHAQGSASPQNSGKRVCARLLSRTNSECCPSTEDAMEVIAVKTKEAADKFCWSSQNPQTPTVSFWLAQFNEHLSQEKEKFKGKPEHEDFVNSLPTAVKNFPRFISKVLCESGCLSALSHFREPLEELENIAPPLMLPILKAVLVLSRKMDGKCTAEDFHQDLKGAQLTLAQKTTFLTSKLYNDYCSVERQSLVDRVKKEGMKPAERAQGINELLREESSPDLEIGRVLFSSEFSAKAKVVYCLKNKETLDLIKEWPLDECADPWLALLPCVQTTSPPTGCIGRIAMFLNCLLDIPDKDRTCIVNPYLAGLLHDLVVTPELQQLEALPSLVNEYIAFKLGWVATPVPEQPPLLVAETPKIARMWVRLQRAWGAALRKMLKQPEPLEAFPWLATLAKFEPLKAYQKENKEVQDTETVDLTQQDNKEVEDKKTMYMAQQDNKTAQGPGIPQGHAQGPGSSQGHAQGSGSSQGHAQGKRAMDTDDITLLELGEHKDKKDKKEKKDNKKGAMDKNDKKHDRDSEEVGKKTKKQKLDTKKVAGSTKKQELGTEEVGHKGKQKADTQEGRKEEKGKKAGPTAADNKGEVVDEQYIPQPSDVFECTVTHEKQLFVYG